MKLISLLPFMDKEDLKDLVAKIKSKEVKGVPLAVLYPFLDKEDLEDLVDHMIEEGNKKEIYSALPFLSKKSINKIFAKVQSGELEGLKEHAFLPFLGKKRIKEIFDDIVKHAEETAAETVKNAGLDELFDDEEDDE